MGAPLVVVVDAGAVVLVLVVVLVVVLGAVVLDGARVVVGPALVPPDEQPLTTIASVATAPIPLRRRAAARLRDAPSARGEPRRPDAPAVMNRSLQA
jgi:hypothetical protein